MAGDHPSDSGTSSLLLVTKTHVPPPRQDLVARPDLQAKLVAGLTRPLPWSRRRPVSARPPCSVPSSTR